MNTVILIGRLTSDLELKKTPSNKSVASFNLAVNRRLTQEQRNNGAQSADFIPCVVWNQQADYLSKYARKGDMISIQGRINTRNYDGQHGKVYVTEVVASEVSILVSKKQPEQQEQHEQPEQSSNYTFKEVAAETTDFQTNLGGDTDVMGYSTVPAIDSDDLPFY